MILLQKGSQDSFRARARDLSEQHENTPSRLFGQYFHNHPPVPESVDADKLRLGGWMACCQAAIFEIFYNLPEQSFEFVNYVAWGEYDWTQGNALEILIKWASEGFRTEDILAAFDRRAPELFHLALDYALHPLIPQITDNKPLADVLNRLVQIEHVGWAYYNYRDRTAGFPPSDDDIRDAQEKLKFDFPEDYADFVKSGYTMGDCPRRALEITPELDYFDLYKSRARLLEEGDLPGDLLPIYQDGSEYYCLQLDGTIRTWSPEKDEGLVWESFKSWRAAMILSCS